MNIARRPELRADSCAAHPAVALNAPSVFGGAGEYVPSCHQSPPHDVLCTVVGSAPARAAAAYASSVPGVAAGSG